MAENGARTDPLRGYNFKLTVGNSTANAHFTSCTSLGVDVEVIKYREAGANQVVKWLPGRVEYSEVTLRYGLTSSTELWDWLQTVVTGKPKRENVSITMLDTDGSSGVLKWDLYEAWPCRWRGAPLDALSREAAIESLTIVFEELKRGPASA